MRGAFVLAEAGLARRPPATTHWSYTEVLAARYPSTDVVHDVLYVDEGRVITSAGSAAGIDACLHILRREHGAEAANATARALVVAPHRAGGQAQFIEYPVPASATVTPSAGPWAIARATRRCRARHQRDRSPRPHEPTDLRSSVPEAAPDCPHSSGCCSSACCGHSTCWRRRPCDIDAVARRCGFSDAVALRPHFRRLVGVPPQAYRATFRAA